MERMLVSENKLTIFDCDLTKQNEQLELSSGFMTIVWLIVVIMTTAIMITS